MPSGRKKRIMVACVTFETSKVVEPALYYEINKAHIIHYVKDPTSENGMIYDSFCQRVCELLREESPREVEVVIHNERVSDFSVMLRTVLSIIQSENDSEEGCEIYVNISAGSPEYSSAATVASMMVPGTIPFSVGTQEYTVPTERIKDVYFVDGMPVGLTKSTYPPRTMPIYTINIPEEHLVRGLRILHERNQAKMSVTSGRMVTSVRPRPCTTRGISSPSGPGTAGSGRTSSATGTSSQKTASTSSTHSTLNNPPVPSRRFAYVPRFMPFSAHGLPVRTRFSHPDPWNA